MNQPIHQKLWKLKQEKRKKTEKFELSVKRRYLKQKEALRKISKAQQTENARIAPEQKRLKPDSGVNFKKRKPIPFEKERKQFMKRAEEKKQKKENQIKEIKQKQKESQKKRFLSKKKYGQRNSRGQPRMKHMIQNLLGKIEKNI